MIIIPGASFTVKPQFHAFLYVMHQHLFAMVAAMLPFHLISSTILVCMKKITTFSLWIYIEKQSQKILKPSVFIEDYLKIAKGFDFCGSSLGVFTTANCCRCRYAIDFWGNQSKCRHSFILFYRQTVSR